MICPMSQTRPEYDPTQVLVGRLKSPCSASSHVIGVAVKTPNPKLGFINWMYNGTTIVGLGSSTLVSACAVLLQYRDSMSAYVCVK